MGIFDNQNCLFYCQTYSSDVADAIAKEMGSIGWVGVGENVWVAGEALSPDLCFRSGSTSLELSCIFKTDYLLSQLAYIQHLGLRLCQIPSQAVIWHRLAPATDAQTKSVANESFSTH
eukprot:1145678-Pelagomonas_calceolata.AAC.6